MATSSSTSEQQPMRAYQFDRGYLCLGCGDEEVKRLKVKSYFDTGYAYSFPQLINGLPELDGPYHCDHCQLFLENPVNAKGLAIVKEILNDALAEPDLLEAYRVCYERLIDWYKPADKHTVVRDPITRELLKPNGDEEAFLKPLRGKPKLRVTPYR